MLPPISGKLQTALEALLNNQGLIKSGEQKRRLGGRLFKSRSSLLREVDVIQPEDNVLDLTKRCHEHNCLDRGQRHIAAHAIAINVRQQVRHVDAGGYPYRFPEMNRS